MGPRRTPNKEIVMSIRSTRTVGAAFLAASLIIAPVHARAEIVSTDAIIAERGANAEREKVLSFLERADAAGKLQKYGVPVRDAQERVAALSDKEVHELAQQIDSLPAGGSFGGFSDQQIIIVLLLLVLVAVLAST